MAVIVVSLKKHVSWPAVVVLVSGAVMLTGTLLDVVKLNVRRSVASLMLTRLRVRLVNVGWLLVRGEDEITYSERDTGSIIQW